MLELVHLYSRHYVGSPSRMLPELATGTLFRGPVSFELIVMLCGSVLVPVLPVAPNLECSRSTAWAAMSSVGTEIIADHHSRVTDISGEHAGASATVSAPLLPV